MADPEVVWDDEEMRFVCDLELLRTGKPVPEVTDASYQADLAMTDLLMRARFVPTTEFKARLQRKLQRQLEVERRHSMLSVFSGSLFRQLFRVAVSASLAVSLLLAVLLVVSPAARAQVQDLIVRFAEVDSPWALLPERSDATSPRAALLTPDPAQPMSGPGMGAAGLPAPSDIPAPPLPEGHLPLTEPMLISLEEAQAETSFTIKMPATLPEGYSFKGVLNLPSLPPLPELEESLPKDASVSHPSLSPPELEESLPKDDSASSGPPSLVILIFENAAGEMLTLSEGILLPPPPGVEVPPLPAGKGSIQEVTVNGQPGQYVEGIWSPQGWDSNATHHQLHWQGADGVIYDLLSWTLGLSELLATAESIP